MEHEHNYSIILIIAKAKRTAGILPNHQLDNLRASNSLLNTGKVVAVGPGSYDRDGKLIPVSVKEGDTVLLPNYDTGTEVKLGDIKYRIYRDEDVLATIHE
ncbi:hypothetical protein Q3G72_023492 [Acer saccharum]|nr:hypothetical protein Q3G72_023492 [Acer saccharum]